MSSSTPEVLPALFRPSTRGTLTFGSHPRFWRRMALFWGALGLVLLVLLGLRLYWQWRAPFSPSVAPIQADTVSRLDLLGNLGDYGYVLFSGDSRLLILADDQRVTGYDLKNPKQVLEIRLADECAGLTFVSCDWSSLYYPSSLRALSPDGRYLAIKHSRGDYAGVGVWDLQTGESVASGHENGAFRFLQFSADGTYIYYDIYNGGLWALNIQTGQRYPLENSDPLRFYQHARHVIYEMQIGQETVVKMVEANRTRQVTTLESPSTSNVWVSPDLSVMFFQQGNQAFLVHDFESGDLRYRLIGHDGSAVHIDFAHTRPYVATSDYNGSILVWNYETGERLHRFENGAYGRNASVQFAADDGMLIAVDYRFVRAWDIETGAVLLARRFNHNSIVAALSPDGRYLVTEGGQIFGIPR